MKAVIDTNVLISAALMRKGLENQIVQAWLDGTFDLILTVEIFEEFERVLQYPKIRKGKWLSAPDEFELLARMAESAFFTAAQVEASICRDPDDDKFLAAAVEGQADYLVSGDKDLLVLGKYKGIRIVRPAAFAAILSRGN